MYGRLIKYFEQPSTIFDQQFGFRSSHSTVHALILVMIKSKKLLTVRPGSDADLFMSRT